MAAKKNAGAAGVPAAAQLLADQLRDATRAIDRAPPPGARDLVLLEGISPKGEFTAPAENVICQLIRILAPQQGVPRVFVYGNSVMFDMAVDGRDPTLVTLRTGAKVEQVASGCLANLFICTFESKTGTLQFGLPPRAAAVLLNAETLTRALHRIALYARRSIFSPDFSLLGPGYHAGCEILVHGPAVEPDLTPLPRGSSPLDRLPPRLRETLGNFCFREPTDLVNYLGLMLTGLLTNHFLAESKAVALVDGNQPGVGKTLLMRVLGIVLDGTDPDRIHYTECDEELQKRICATLRPGQQTVLIIDNAKQPSGSPISSPVIETNSEGDKISLRILGVSENYVRPNDVIWTLTMNQTRVSADLMSRGLPIRLAYEGSPDARVFTGPDPLAHARRHRLEILGELAGMVVRWVQQGRPLGTRSHRFHHWAKTIGGILEANGFDGFLANYQEATQTFNADLDDLAALVDAAVSQTDGPYVLVQPEGGKR